MLGFIQRIFDSEGVIVQLKNRIYALDSQVAELQGIVNFHKSVAESKERLLQAQQIKIDALNDQLATVTRSDIDTKQKLSEAKDSYAVIYTKNIELAQQIMELKDDIKNYKNQIKTLKAKRTA